MDVDSLWNEGARVSRFLQVPAQLDLGISPQLQKGLGHLWSFAERVFLAWPGDSFQSSQALALSLIREPSSVAWQNRVASSALLECWRTGEVARQWEGGGLQAKWMTFRYTK